ncbi:Uncharacterized protein FWK35_00020025 [Aphis craccivora]|uniref:Uncharacterized protein n=1 Tax=Aphis craccivora TaxID=307492 RepID=A0A6G0XSB3_APHCR|nr:Uncharacterized protein FWK35_00020025 [Aphis craccivora]
MLQFQTLRVVFDGKVNILEVKSKHFPIVFKKIEKNKKKSDRKTGIFLRKTSFRPNRFFYMVVTQKLITFKYLGNLSKTRKFANTRKFYHYLKIQPTTEIFNFSEKNFLKRNFFLLAFELKIHKILSS